MKIEQLIPDIKKSLSNAVSFSRQFSEGRVADYIPELTNVNQDYTGAAITLVNGQQFFGGDDPLEMFTMQSVSKLVLFLGLMEDLGPNKVYKAIGVEPSGKPFSAIGDLEQYGNLPSNPLINAGAIALANLIPGDNVEEQLNWVNYWIEKLFGEKLVNNESVFNSEWQNANLNRSIAYMLKNNDILTRDVEKVLIPYFRLCSFEINVKIASRLAMLLANGGLMLSTKQRIISETSCNHTVSVMATCGLYDESGISLVRVGMPAKSSVSGLIIAVATGRGGLAVISPKVNSKGNSVRGMHILEHVSSDLGWHFASPWGHQVDGSRLGN